MYSGPHNIGAWCSDDSCWDSLYLPHVKGMRTMWFPCSGFYCRVQECSVESSGRSVPTSRKQLFGLRVFWFHSHIV